MQIKIISYLLILFIGLIGEMRADGELLGDIITATDKKVSRVRKGIKESSAIIRIDRISYNKGIVQRFDDPKSKWYRFTLGYDKHMDCAVDLSYDVEKKDFELFKGLINSDLSVLSISQLSADVRVPTHIISFFDKEKRLIFFTSLCLITKTLYFDYEYLQWYPLHTLSEKTCSSILAKVPFSKNQMKDLGQFKKYLVGKNSIYKNGDDYDSFSKFAPSMLNSK